MQTQSYCTNIFQTLPYEITREVFQHVDPSQQGIIALVCREWNELITDENLCVWKKDYKVNTGLRTCHVTDYTGMLSVEAKANKNSFKGLGFGFVSNLLERGPIILELGRFALRNDRRYLQPGYEITGENPFTLVYSDRLVVRRISGGLIHIEEHDVEFNQDIPVTFTTEKSRGSGNKEGNHNYCIDTSENYSVDDREGFFIYDYMPREMSHDEVRKKFDDIMKTVSLSEFRCIYNSRGIVVEANVDDKFKIYLTRPDDIWFVEIKVGYLG